LAPTVIGSDRIVRPADNALHTSYTFYVKVMSSNGGSNKYFGPYTLHVGCTTNSVAFSNNPSLITAQRRYVGESVTNAYVLSVPVLVPTSRVWCLNTQNEIVNDDATGTAWTTGVKLTPNGV